MVHYMLYYQSLATEVEMMNNTRRESAGRFLDDVLLKLQLLPLANGPRAVAEHAAGRREGRWGVRPTGNGRRGSRAEAEARDAQNCALYSLKWAEFVLCLAWL